MTPSESRTLLEEIRANQVRLEACLGPHDFVVCETLGSIPRRYQCQKCQGTADPTFVSGYKKGLAHGRTHSWAAVPQVAKPE